MINIIALVGKTSSGKNVIMQELTRICNMKPIISYTTRPMRQGETDGVEYHFITEEEFTKKKEEGFFEETTSYQVINNEIWHYGTAKDSFVDEDSVIIVNPDGLKYLKSQSNLDLTVFYIHSNEDIIRGRLIQRGDNPLEAERRLVADNNDFADIDQYYNYAIENNGRKSPTILAEEIWLIYKTEKRLLEDLKEQQLHAARDLEQRR